MKRNGRPPASDAEDSSPHSPEQWLDDLAAQLRGLDDVFLAMKATLDGRPVAPEYLGDVDPADLTHQYTRIVSRVFEALKERPQFAGDVGLRGLWALRTDLQALNEGHEPKRLCRRKGVSVGESNIGHRVYQAQLVLCVKLLEAIGFNNAKARKRVAGIFARAGHRGRRGGATSADTLYRWQMGFYCDPGPSHESGYKYIEGELAKWKRLPAWPPSEAEAVSWVQQRAANPEISLAHTT